MDVEKLKELLAKLPLIPVLLLWSANLGWDYHSFQSSSDSPLVVQQQEIQTLRDANTTLETQLKQIQEFAKNLEIKKLDIRNLTQELDSLKTSMSESLDLPDFMKSTLTEARKVGLNILSLRPTTATTHEYYAEQAFDLKFQGAFVQLVVFLDRLASMQKIVRVEDFQVAPLGSPMAKYVELQGVVQIKAYRYLGSKADELTKTANNGKTPGAEGRGQ